MTKDEVKDEIKNRINMALKGSIEIICKNLAELEKENKNLKALKKYELNVAKLEIEKLEQRNVKLIALINAERERQEKCDGVHLRKIAELEKENAELKKENTELKTRWQCRNKYVCNDNGKGVPCYIYYGCLNCHYKIE